MVFAVGGCLWAAGAAFSGAPAGLAARTGSLRGAVMSADGVSRREMMQSASAAAAAAAASGSFLPQAASAKGANAWQVVDLPIATEAPILFDIDFDPQNALRLHFGVPLSDGDGFVHAAVDQDDWRPLARNVADGVQLLAYGTVPRFERQVFDRALEEPGFLARPMASPTFM